MERIQQSVKHNILDFRRRIMRFWANLEDLSSLDEGEKEYFPIETLQTVAQLVTLYSVISNVEELEEEKLTIQSMIHDCFRIYQSF